MTNQAPFSPDDIPDWFWSIIDDAKRDRDRLADLLSEMEQQDIVRFHHCFVEAAIELMYPPFTQHTENLSEDGTQDVAEWVVSQGKEFYSQVWNNPEMILKRIDVNDPHTFTAVADNLYWDRFDECILPLED